ncbi:hypothetical protein [Comamonas sp.]|uniref:hypothetical protein n=1 Tax=Comamonas sp. TaxID=34028 RepID=UPI0025905414|nr:hypothetical protein [Comamonas sp.]
MKFRLGGHFTKRFATVVLITGACTSVLADVVTVLPEVVVTDTGISWTGGSSTVYMPNSIFTGSSYGLGGPVMTPDKINMVQIQLKACTSYAHGSGVKQSRHTDDPEVRNAVASAMMGELVVRQMASTAYRMNHQIQTSAGIRNVVQVFYADGWRESWIALPSQSMSIRFYPEPMPNSLFPPRLGDASCI